ncbi:MAG: HD domain-containing protein [Thermodesulfovibrionales bacterium]|nr:HD domain-containing protein [Thermodesulfovibrionales bacterium]
MAESKTSEFISSVMTALSNCSLYSKDHPFVSEFSEKAVKLAQDLFKEDSLDLTILGDTLMINGELFRETGTHVQNFIRRIKKKGIERITISKGVNLQEFINFIVALSGYEKINSTPHISVGIVEVKFRGEGIDISSIVNEKIEKVKGVYTSASRFKKIDMVSLEDAVAGFISALKRENNVLKVISPVKSHSEYTYVHITNVSILTIFQAELLGLKGEILHEAGLAGLLHDIGKTYIPKEVLEKPTRLTPSEWEEMKKHPVYGALYLSTLPEVPRLAVIAAFEHHMKFDGSGYPDTKRYGKKQHLISQLVAIADFFDAMRTHRSYRRSLGVNEVIKLMFDLAGTEFNPLLVENFADGLKRIHAL